MTVLSRVGLAAVALAVTAAGSAAQDVKSGLILAPKPFQTSWPGRYDSETVRLRVRNDDKAPVAIEAPKVLSLTSGGSVVAGEPKISSGDCGTSIRAGQDCSFALTVPDGLPAGVYTIDVGVAGTNGGFSTQSLTVNVRANGFLAFLTAFIGLWMGSYLKFWRDAGRKAIEGLIALNRLKERLAALPPDADRDLASMRLAIARAIDDARNAVGDHADPTASVKAIREKINLYAAAQEKAQAAAAQAAAAANSSGADAASGGAGSPPADREASQDGAAKPSSLDLEWGGVLAWLAGLTRTELEHKLRFGDYATNAVLLLAASLGAFKIAADSPTWGTADDFIALFLGALAVRVVADASGFPSLTMAKLR